jgi:asparagine synthase (glutamine-hydrolysing)
MLNAPEELKLNRGWTKWLMRSAYGDQLPREIIWRKDKQGFR